MLKVFLLIAKRLISVCAHAVSTLCASTSHYQVQLSVPIFHSCLSTWHSDDACQNTWKCEHNPWMLGAKFHTQYSTITANVWTTFCFCCSFKYFLLLHCKTTQRKVSHQAGYFLACIGPMNFWTEASIFKREEHFCNHIRYARHQIRAALNQPSSCKCKL